MIFLLTSISESFISRFPTFRFFLSPYYKKRLDAEVLGGKITSSDVVCCLGGGAFPATAIGIYERTQARVCVIDCDLKAVRKAKCVIKKLDLHHAIDVVCMDGIHCSFESFDVLHVARQVMPRDIIITKAFDTMQQGSRVIVRTEGTKGLNSHCQHTIDYRRGFNKATMVYQL